MSRALPPKTCRASANAPGSSMPGATRAEQHGFVNTPIYRGSTVLYPTTDDLLHRARALHLRHQGHADDGGARDAPGRDLAGAAGTVLAPSGPRRGHARADVLPQGRRPSAVTDSVYRPTRHFCDGVLEALRRRDDLLRPADRRRHRGAAAAEHDGGVHRGARARNPSRCRTSRPSPRSAHRHGAVVLMDNTWATPLLFPPHERGVDLAIEAGTKYLSGGSDLLLGLVSANERCLASVCARTYDAFAMCAGPGGRLPRRCAACAPWRCACKEHEQQALDMARWLAAPPGGRAACSTRRSRAIPATRSGSATSRARRGCSRSCSKPCADRAPRRRCSTASSCSGWALPGAASRASSIPFDCAAYRTATRMEAGGPGAALPYRPRRPRRPQGRSRCRVRAAAARGGEGGVRVGRQSSVVKRRSRRPTT